MKKILLGISLALLFTGCASNYVIKLNNGSQIGTKSKPKLKDGMYVFTDMNGQQRFVQEGRVREISPASMANEKSSQFLPR